MNHLNSLIKAKSNNTDFVKLVHNKMLPCWNSRIKFHVLHHMVQKKANEINYSLKCQGKAVGGKCCQNTALCIFSICINSMHHRRESCSVVCCSVLQCAVFWVIWVLMERAQAQAAAVAAFPTIDRIMEGLGAECFGSSDRNVNALQLFIIPFS